ncbi:hypothetical protein G5B10_11735 [Fluviicola sp. SGL-29]|nr:hypothetical protein [Fluviicola sp. SGL-29]
MNAKKILITVTTVLVVVTSCKKEKPQPNNPKSGEEQENPIGGDTTIVDSFNYKFQFRINTNGDINNVSDITLEYVKREPIVNGSSTPPDTLIHDFVPITVVIPSGYNFINGTMVVYTDELKSFLNNVVDNGYDEPYNGNSQHGLWQQLSIRFKYNGNISTENVKTYFVNDGTYSAGSTHPTTPQSLGNGWYRFDISQQYLTH